MDGGLESARGFVWRTLLSDTSILNSALTDDNYKSALLEYAQANGLGVPRYTIVKEEGPDHDRTFTVEVTISGKKHGAGTGKNKKEAEQHAARIALERVQEV